MTAKQAIKLLKKVPPPTQIYFYDRFKDEDIYYARLDSIWIKTEKRSGEISVYLESDYVNCGD